MKKLKLDYQQRLFFKEVPIFAAVAAAVMSIGGAAVEQVGHVAQSLASDHKEYVSSPEHAEKIRNARIDECAELAIKDKDYAKASINFQMVCTLSGATATNTAQAASSLTPGSNLVASFDEDFINEEVRIKNYQINAQADLMVKSANLVTKFGHEAKVYSPVAAAAIPLSPISYGIGVLGTMAICAAGSALSRRREKVVPAHPQLNAA